MRNISCRKIITVFIIGLLWTGAQAQTKSSKSNRNFLDFQKKPFYFGITMGINSGGFKINRSSEFSESDSIRIINSPLRGGFNLHIITNLKIGDNFDFRFVPGFSFGERRFEIINAANAVEVQSQESVMFETPLLLRFKSAPYKDKRVFVIGGVKYIYDVSNNSNSQADNAANDLFYSPHDFQFEIGAGIQFFLPFFIFSPEIKFSQGISNIHIYRNELEKSRVIDQLLTRTFSISFHFEG